MLQDSVLPQMPSLWDALKNPAEQDLGYLLFPPLCCAGESDIFVLTPYC